MKSSDKIYDYISTFSITEIFKNKKDMTFDSTLEFISIPFISYKHNFAVIKGNNSATVYQFAEWPNYPMVVGKVYEKDKKYCVNLNMSYTIIFPILTLLMSIILLYFNINKIASSLLLFSIVSIIYGIISYHINEGKMLAIIITVFELKKAGEQAAGAVK